MLFSQIDDRILAALNHCVRFHELRFIQTIRVCVKQSYPSALVYPELVEELRYTVIKHCADSTIFERNNI